jgi:hypothetical protein
MRDRGCISHVHIGLPDSTTTPHLRASRTQRPCPDRGPPASTSARALRAASRPSRAAAPRETIHQALTPNFCAAMARRIGSAHRIRTKVAFTEGSARGTRDRTRDEGSEPEGSEPRLPSPMGGGCLRRECGDGGCKPSRRPAEIRMRRDLFVGARADYGETDARQRCVAVVSRERAEVVRWTGPRQLLATGSHTTPAYLRNQKVPVGKAAQGVPATKAALASR